MQVTRCSPATAAPWSTRPTVGALMALYEENYALLGRLVPALPMRRGLLLSHRPGVVDLQLTIESQSPYTTLLRLTHVFGGDAAGRSAFGSDPDARLRAYHDARQVEVLALRQTALPLHADYQPPAFDSKWRVNLFLAKWLAFCLQQGHCFLAPGVPCIPLAEDHDLACSCR